MRFAFVICAPAFCLLLACGAGTGSTPVEAGSGDLYVPSAIAAPLVPAGERLVTEFGARPDDGVDDTAAIQAGLDAVHAAGGGTLVFPPGRYDISINTSLRRALTLYPRLRLLGRPAGQATLRLADKQVLYESMMATASYPTRLDDAEFIDLNFDANGLQNPVRDPAETNGDLGTPTLRYVIRSYAGQRVRVSGCTFSNLENGNTLSFNGTAVSDVLIENNRFINVGGALIDHDHSTVYIDGPRIRIANNEFRSRFGAGTLGARTALETHGDDQEVRGNSINGYLQGANAVGLVTQPARQLYVGNSFSGVAVGINIWPLGPALLATQTPAFANLMMRGNDIRIDANAWWASPAMVINAPAGIHFEADVANAKLARLSIVDNSIRFDTYAGRGADRDRVSAGIELRGVEGRLSIDVLILSGNTVRNTIGPGILSVATVGSATASSINNNTLIDSGRAPSLVGAGDLLRSGVVLGGSNRNLKVTANTINNSAGATGPTLNGVVLGSSCAESCSVGANVATGLSSALQIVGTGWVNTGP
jgi:Pectate lyase superfamily protein